MDLHVNLVHMEMVILNILASVILAMLLALIVIHLLLIAVYLAHLDTLSHIMERVFVFQDVVGEMLTQAGIASKIRYQMT